jgi:ABC-type Fe3+ transport system substrate-binding protein
VGARLYSSLFLALLLLAALHPVIDAKAQEGITLRIISRHPGEILTKTEEEFLKSEIAKRFNIVDLRFYQVPPTQWKSAIERRGDIDVAWGGGPTLFDFLFQEGLLSPLSSSMVLEAAGQIPDTFAGSPMKRVSEGKIYWVAASIASFGFTVNHDLLKRYDLPVPRKWSDLASPEFARPLIEENIPVVSIADPTRSTSNTRMYEIILQAYGWDLGWVNLTLMAANSLIEDASSAVRDNVIQGRVAVGITIDFYGYTAMKANPATEYIIPEGETIVNGDPIALLVTSKNPEAAQAFIAWVLTEGQKIWFREDINRLPANPNAFNLPEGRERQDLKEIWEKLSKAQSMEFDDNLALSIEVAMQLYFNATLVQLNSLLKEVWKALLEKYFAGEISEEEFKAYMKRLGSPLEYVDPVTGEVRVFTLEDAQRVTKLVREDPRLRDAYIAAWREAAAERYEALLAELGG